MLLRPLQHRSSPSLATATPSSPLSFTRLARPLLVAFGFSLPFLPASRPVTLLDTSPAYSTSSSPQSRAKTPLITENRTLNPAAVKQISLGSILGLGVGVLLSAFSRSLTLMLGVGVVVWQYAARRGYNFIPVDRMQRYVRGINLRSAVQENVAFKMSFGLMCALAAFGSFDTTN